MTILQLVLLTTAAVVPLAVYSHEEAIAQHQRSKRLRGRKAQVHVKESEWNGMHETNLLEGFMNFALRAGSTTIRNDPYGRNFEHRVTRGWLFDILDVMEEDGEKGKNDGGYEKIGTGATSCDRHKSGTDISCFIHLNVENVLGSGFSGTIRAAGSAIGKAGPNDIDYIVTDVTGAFADLPSLGFIGSASHGGLGSDTDRSVHGEYSSRMKLDYALGPTRLSVRVQLYRPEDQLLLAYTAPDF